MASDYKDRPCKNKGRGQEIVKAFRTCVCLCIRSSRFNISLNILFIYKDIFVNFAGNVYGYKNLSLQNFSLILKNKMAAIANCLQNHKVVLTLEIFQLASSNLHKRYMARTTGFIVIFT